MIDAYADVFADELNVKAVGTLGTAGEAVEYSLKAIQFETKAWIIDGKTILEITIPKINSNQIKVRHCPMYPSLSCPNRPIYDLLMHGA